MYKFLIFSMLSLYLFTGCSSATLNVNAQPSMNEKIKTIALSPSSGILGDAIGIELLKYGYDVYDSEQLSSSIVSMNMNEIQILQPENLQRIKNKIGVDSILLVKTISGYDNKPQSASIKLVSTSTARIIAGATWQNGSAGQKGSPMDRGARSDIADASKQIAEGLAKSLQKQQ